MNLEKLITDYMNDGMTRTKAVAKVCSETLLYRISKSSVSRNVTVKGGVVIMNLSGDERRTTKDLDLDFIRYSLDDQSIIDFLNKLNNIDSEIKIKATTPIKELRHDNYRGKKVNLNINDNFKHNYNFILDIGAHRFSDLEQEEYYFNINSYNEKVSLLINSKEQIFYEKLESLLNKGATTSRYKDLFDFYYFIKIDPINIDKFKNIVTRYLLETDTVLEETFNDIYNRLSEIFEIKDFVNNVTINKYNWLELSGEEVIEAILNFFKLLTSEEVAV